MATQWVSWTQTLGSRLFQRQASIQNNVVDTEEQRKWYLNQNIVISIQEKWFRNVIWKWPFNEGLNVIDPVMGLRHA